MNVSHTGVNIFRVRCTKRVWQIKRGGGGGGGGFNDLFTTINADCLISCYVIINEGLGRGCDWGWGCLGPPPDPILIFKVLYWQLLIVAFILLTVCGCKHECSPIAWHGSCVPK